VPAVLLNILRARNEELYPKLVSRLIGPFIPLCHCYVEEKIGAIASEVLGDHCRQTQQSRLELGAVFLRLEGSVQKSGDAVRVNVQL
jgi:hypothetical protein